MCYSCNNSLHMDCPCHAFTQYSCVRLLVGWQLDRLLFCCTSRCVTCFLRADEQHVGSEQDELCIIVQAGGLVLSMLWRLEHCMG